MWSIAHKDLIKPSLPFFIIQCNNKKHKHPFPLYNIKFLYARYTYNSEQKKMSNTTNAIKNGSFESDVKRVGELTVYTGPMCSGKTTELLNKMDELVKKHPGRCKLVKYSLDTRYEASEIVGKVDNVKEYLASAIIPRTKKQLQRRADFIVDTCTEFYSQLRNPAHKTIYDEVKHIFIDEGQFFVDIDKVVFTLRCEGVNVYVAALNSTFLMQPWKTTSHLLASASHIELKQAYCSLGTDCNKPAQHTSKVGGNLNVTTEIGGENMYRPACKDCMFAYMKSLRE